MAFFHSFEEFYNFAESFTYLKQPEMRYTYEQYVNLTQQKDTQERSQKTVQSTDCSYRSYGERLGAIGGGGLTNQRLKGGHLCGRTA